jgi:iron complex outermembrane recepter protein
MTKYCHAYIVATAFIVVAKAEIKTVPLDEVVVTSSPLEKTLFDLAQPASVLNQKEVEKKFSSSLGDLLKNEPGISSTGFAPGASRPIIRGLGDDRIRILQNGTSALDVSNVSADHAVSSDPISIRSVEVVRGSATLLYGPNTIGGVVNMIDDRIAEEKFNAASPIGKFQTSYGSVDESWSAAGAVKFGKGPWVFHVDGFQRESDDIRIAGFARSAALRKDEPLAAGQKEAKGSLPNSATESRGGGVGASYDWDRGFFGASFSGLESTYGTVGEPDVTIGMKQRRFDLRGGVYQPTNWLKEIDFKFGYSNYDHTEFEGKEIGTKFKIDGFNGRFDFKHEKIGMLEGAFGYEIQQSEFSALGEEAFLPPVENLINSLFLFEELSLTEKLRLQFGGRYDHQTNETEKFAGFGNAKNRDFDSFSLSSGLVYNPVEEYAVAFTAAYTQRPPTYVELFANGPHVATSTFEVGDENLDTENSVSIDLSVRKKTGRVTGNAGVFYYHFNNYINLQPTGANDADIELPIFAYKAVDADFAGGELEAAFHLLEPISKETKAEVTKLDLVWRADYVRAENKKANEPLARITPFRTSLALEYQKNGFGARLEVQYVDQQNRVAEGERETDCFFLMNAGLSYEMKIANTITSFHLKGANLTNEEARNHSSFLKDVAPLAGRGVIFGITTKF